MISYTIYLSIMLQRKPTYYLGLEKGLGQPEAHSARLTSDWVTSLGWVGLVCRVCLFFWTGLVIYSWSSLSSSLNKAQHRARIHAQMPRKLLYICFFFLNLLTYIPIFYATCLGLICTLWANTIHEILFPHKHINISCLLKLYISTIICHTYL